MIQTICQSSSVPPRTHCTLPPLIGMCPVYQAAFGYTNFIYGSMHWGCMRSKESLLSVIVCVSYMWQSSATVLTDLLDKVMHRFLVRSQRETFACCLMVLLVEAVVCIGGKAPNGRSIAHAAFSS